MSYDRRNLQYQAPLNWRVTRSLVSYDCLFFDSCSFSCNWRVTRSLVSYDLNLIETTFYLYKLKGHQIIGELRLRIVGWLLKTEYWRVTRSLVSYDTATTQNPTLCKLKGHQIIGELRHEPVKRVYNLFNWRVTRSLVSYDRARLTWLSPLIIEGSPDHWWVTTSCTLLEYNLDKLKGHQIIGELLPSDILIMHQHCYWRVTRSLVSYYSSKNQLCWIRLNWRVTRSLVSYCTLLIQMILGYNPLKGHQIIGELLRWLLLMWSRFWYWRVTRSLVSYYNRLFAVLTAIAIEGSPDHWWVTTFWYFNNASALLLKGHQIIGELRRNLWSINEVQVNWRVTRSLVSYDYVLQFLSDYKPLKGHQIIGELRLFCLRDCRKSCELKGHQIIGELRPVFSS